MSNGLKDALTTGNVSFNYSPSRDELVEKLDKMVKEHNEKYRETGVMPKKLKEGTKYDNGKSILALVPPSLEEAVGDILTMGALKYSPNNWKKGINYTRIVSSLKRHLNEFYKGNLIDEESNKPHLWHAACNIAFLIEFESNVEKYSKFNDLHEED